MRSYLVEKGPTTETSLRTLHLKKIFVSLVSLSGLIWHDGPDLKLFILVGWDRSFRLLLGPPGLN